MKTIFADTGYWIALLDPQDTLHQKVVNLSIALAQERICTSEMVFTEVLNHFAKRGNFLRQAAAALVKSVQGMKFFHKHLTCFDKPSRSTVSARIKPGVTQTAPHFASCSSKAFWKPWHTTNTLSRLASSLCFGR